MVYLPVNQDKEIKQKNKLGFFSSSGTRWWDKSGKEKDRNNYPQTKHIGRVNSAKYCQRPSYGVKLGNEFISSVKDHTIEDNQYSITSVPWSP